MFVVVGGELITSFSAHPLYFSRKMVIVHVTIISPVKVRGDLLIVHLAPD